MAGLYLGDALIRLRNGGCVAVEYRKGRKWKIVAKKQDRSKEFQPDVRGLFDADEIAVFLKGSTKLR